MIHRPERRSSGRFVLEPLEPRVLLNGSAPTPPAEAAPEHTEVRPSITVVSSGQGEVLHQTSDLFGDISKLNPLLDRHPTVPSFGPKTETSQPVQADVGSSVNALQANLGADRTKLECLQPMADGTFAYFLKVQALAGDVTQIELSRRGLGDFALDQPSGPLGKVAELPNWETTLNQTGRFLFVPKLPLEAGEMDLNLSATTIGDLTDCFGLPVLNASPVTLTVILEVRDGYSVAGINAVTFGNERQDILRQQQRLTYLGFPGKDTNPLVVDGLTGENTRWAAQLFNAAVTDQDFPSVSGTPLNDFINARNAPRWVEIVAQPGLVIAPNDDDTPQSERWGTNWAMEVIQAALQRYRTLHADDDILFKGATTFAGGPTTQHASHQAGMDVDIEVEAATNTITSPWYVTREVNGTTYVAASTGSNHIVWKLPDGTYKGAAPPTATGGLPAGIPAGSQALEQSYEGVYNKEEVLRAINDKGLFVLTDGYKKEQPLVFDKLRSFLAINGTAATTSSGAGVKSIFYNDPAAWSISTDPNEPVRFSSKHGGHFHVNIKTPALVSDGLSAAQTDSILQGLDGFEEWLRRLSIYDPSPPDSQDTLHALAETQSYALGSTLPLIGHSLGQLISLGDIVNGQLIAPVRSYFAMDQTPTASELINLLSSISFSAGGLTVRTDPQKSSMDLVHLVDHDEVRFNLDLQAKASTNLSLLLPAIAQSLGVTLDDAAKLNVSAAADLVFTLGVNLDPNLSPANAFFISVKNLGATVSAEASGLKAAGKMAEITVNVTNGTVKLGAGVSIAFGAGRLSTGDLSTKPLSSLVHFTFLPVTASASLAVTASPINIAGTAVVLSGTLSVTPRTLDYSISATVTDWHPISFLTVNTLTVTLDKSALRLETTATIAGVNGVKLKGDYDLKSSSYALAASAPINWTLISGVNLSNVAFTVTNRNADGSAGDTLVGASGHLRLFGTDFDVHAHVTPSGAWIAAIPQAPLVLVPGLVIDSPVVFATTYDFVVDRTTDKEIAGVTSPQNDQQRKITTGVNLVATTHLPENIPAIGGSTAQISGVLGTELSQMALEAKVALAHPPEIAGLLAFDSVGLRITGDLTMTVFGEGRVLHDKIPGLGEDIAVRAGLTLDLVHTTLKGSLSLLHPLNNFFGVQGLNILEGDGTFGINFATTPLPLPTVGFNFLVEIPTFAQDLLALPPRLSAAVNVSSTEPIMAMSAENWQPLSKVGLKNLTIKEGEVVIAPNGGTIGLRVFPRGFSAAFITNLFGTDVDFEGRFDEQNKGITLASYVSSFTIAGVNITGAGPDGIYQDGKATNGPNDPDNDNGASFRAELTPQKQALSFSGRVSLPGKTDQGQDAFIQLDGKIDTTGLTLTGQIANWNVVPLVLNVSTAKFDATVPLADIAKGSVIVAGDLTLLQAPIQIEGSLSSKGMTFDGSLKSPGRLAGLGISDFTLSFSTLPNDQHFFIQFTIDLPGSGGLTTVRGTFQDQNLVLDAAINNWQPIPALTFNGALHAALSLSAPSLDLDFDITGSILGASAHFTGTLSSSPSGFKIFATSDVALKLPTGQKVAGLEATIDLGKDSSFQITLAGDFPLAGTQPTTAHLQGSIGASGITLFGTIDDWVLVPGLAFDGLVKLRFKAGVKATSAGLIIGPIQRIPVEVDPTVTTDPLPSSTKDLTIQIDISTSLLGSNLRLVGNLTGNGSGLDFDLTGRVKLSGPLVAGVVLDLDASVLTQTSPLGVKTYRLTFSGDLEIFSGFEAVHINATMQGDSNGNWSLTVEGGVGFDVSATIDDIINLSIGANIDGTLVLRSSGDLAFGLTVDGHARARVPSLGFDDTVNLSFGIKVDLSEGTATIPNARPKIDHNKLGVATGISWHDYVLKTPAPEAPKPTVTATFTPSVIRNRPGTIQVRGTNAPERISVSFLPRAFGSTEDTLVISGATGSSSLVNLLSISTPSIDLLDIDMGGGNDTVTLSLTNRLASDAPQFRTVVRGGLGSDTITMTGISATIYGNRENATDDQIDGADVISTGPSASSVFGGGGDDIITTGTNTSVDGGTGYNIINGTLFIQGSAGADHISITTSTTGGTRPRHDPFGPAPASTIVVQNVQEQGPLVTLTTVPIENVGRIQIDGLAGNDVITVSANVALPTTLNGGDGNDLIQAGSGPTTITGGKGNDTLRGGAGNDNIQGNEADDEIFAGAGANVIDGGVGHDIIHANGSATVQAETDDLILSEGGAVSISGGNVAITNVTINGGAAQRSFIKTIAIQFNRDVSASLSSDDLQILANSGDKIPSSAFSLAWDGAQNTALLTFIVPLAGGSHTLALRSGDVIDVSANTLAVDFTTKFFVLAGDVNGDGRVNSLDLLAVSRELARPDNTRDLTKDANGDGKLDTADLSFIRAHFLSKST